jgi:hypothetical protein
MDSVFSSGERFGRRGTTTSIPTLQAETPPPPICFIKHHIARRRQVASFTPRPLYCRRKSPRLTKCVRQQKVKRRAGVWADQSSTSDHVTQAEWQKCECAPEYAWMFWRREKYVQCRESKSDFTAVKPQVYPLYSMDWIHKDQDNPLRFFHSNIRHPQ